MKRPKLELGYYWIMIGYEWFVALHHKQGEFYVCGDEEPFTFDDITTIGEKIKEP